MSENMKERLFKLLSWVVIVAVSGLAAYLGLGQIPPPEVFVNVPGVESGVVEYGYQTLCYMTSGGDKLQCDSGGEIEVNSGATLDLNGSVDFNGATITNMSLADGELTLDSVAFSGPLTFGSTSVVSGTRVAHGLATTPTIVVLTPYTTTYQSALINTAIFASNATSFTVAITPSIATALTMYWLAGK